MNRSSKRERRSEYSVQNGVKAFRIIRQPQYMYIQSDNNEEHHGEQRLEMMVSINKFEQIGQIKDGRPSEIAWCFHCLIEGVKHLQGRRSRMV